MKNVITHRPNGSVCSPRERMADAYIKGLPFVCGNDSVENGWLFVDGYPLMMPADDGRGFTLLRLWDRTDEDQLYLIGEVMGEVYYRADEFALCDSAYEDLCLRKTKDGIYLSAGHVSGDEFKHLLEWKINPIVNYKFTWDDAGFHLADLNGGLVETC